ncbi:MAG: Mediator of RNA polymerase II transcription subunit 6 [Claussenomyces sp. TS43310]|nr:MAG: Mediator of RNA polymerase II transcription subunit 6 [Claussenomyces sp. TS43310]
MAARASDPPLDEIQWRSPEIAAGMMGIHTNSVLHYFARSPFFDPTSNNAVLVSQFGNNPRMVYIVETREAMEARLKTMSGLEFMVAQEPAEMDPGTGTGVWVIRKQNRRKRQGQEDEVTVQATYFVVGENIYMAPTVADVIGNRLLSIFTCMNSFFSTAATESTFSPALGHTYLPPSSTSRLRAGESQLGQTSKENTPMPDSVSGIKKTLPASASHSTYLSSRLLDESFKMSLQYGEEYMDENPITGQPGDFHLSTSGRKGRDKLTVPAPVKGSLQTQSKRTASPALEIKGPEVPPSRKGSRGDKSPKTPGIPKPKRRKSKVSVSAGGTSPS